MQTFLPYRSFSASAEALDRQRLGKQRVEAWQILRTLAGESDGWRNHPAVRMWRGYEFALAEYGVVICNEWRARDYRDSMGTRFMDKILGHRVNGDTLVYPSWLGNKEFHRSHRSNLIRKAPHHYGVMWLDVPDDLPYVWPVP